ncbi:hypothetical protein N9H39_06515 [Gammaproteobacteria bacterium]|nr:hypothetical protein [Gammaproteobacteria bacterium]
MNAINQLILNTVDLDNQRQFAAIIGINPSQGARSPVLWNAAFRAQGENTEMVALDITPENLTKVLRLLEDDSRFVGGAVAAPHKEAVAEWLSHRDGHRLTSEVDAIGAVNCLYRGKVNGNLHGANTDGEGALRSLKEICPNLPGKNIILLGLGGAGKAVAAYVAEDMQAQGSLSISNRKSSRLIEKFCECIGAKLLQWPPSSSDYAGTDIIINCTTIGSNNTQVISGETVELNSYSPLCNLNARNNKQSRSILDILPKTATVFDIIYDPNPTRLLVLASKCGLQTLNGSRMNLEQAIIAFCYATYTQSTEAVRAAMTRERNKLD